MRVVTTRTMAALLVSALGAISPRAPMAFAAQAQPSPSVAAARTRQGTFTLVRVDPANGTLVLHESEVGTIEMRAGRRLELGHVEPGQQLEMTYYPEVALALERTGHRRSKSLGARVRLTGVAARQPTLTEGVVSVDTLGHTVTVRAPSGWTHVIRVTDPGLQVELEGLRTGEHLQMTYSEALAVSVAPAE